MYKNHYFKGIFSHLGNCPFNGPKRTTCKEKNRRRASGNQRSEIMYTYTAPREDHFPNSPRSRPCSSTQAVPSNSTKILAANSDENNYECHIEMPDLSEKDGLSSSQAEITKRDYVFHKDK